jgi:hypothetical protein
MKQISDVTILTNKNGLVEVDINAASDWESFDKILQFLKINYGANILKVIDGVGERFANIKIGNVDLFLEHDDFYGNTLKSNSKQANNVIKFIGDDIKNRFDQV